MNIIKLIFVSFFALLLLNIFSGCRKLNLPLDEKAEDKIVKLETRGESPKSKIHDYKTGDQVAIVKNDGTFEVVAQIEEISGKLVFAPTYSRGSRGREIWMPIENAQNLQGNEKVISKGYKVRIGEGRLTSYEWFPPEQIFPAPWANNANLKVGNIIYEKTFGNFKPKKGIITELPATESGDFNVLFDGEERGSWVHQTDIFSAIEPIKNESLSPGDTVYYDNSYWALVIGRYDDKIIIRETGFASNDMIVDLSKLQHFR